jgi:phosphohistidine phosphatase
MKIILLIRHAHSSWHDHALADFERKLTEAGKEDARRMAKRLLEKGIKIDSFISSAAKRAESTAKIFMKEYGADKHSLKLMPSLYNPSVKDLYDAVENCDDKEKTVALFSHNPGITDFVNSLDSTPVYDMPTCGVYAIRADIKQWKDFSVAEKEFLFFDFPKNHS